jgi:hypothetical protein
MECSFCPCFRNNDGLPERDRTLLNGIVQQRMALKLTRWLNAVCYLIPSCSNLNLSRQPLKSVVPRWKPAFGLYCRPKCILVSIGEH